MVINSYADGCAFIEGKYVPIVEARIPIMDTGFTRSDLKSILSSMIIVFSVKASIQIPSGSECTRRFVWQFHILRWWGSQES